MAEQDQHLIKYNECEKLYKQAKYTECTKLALENLKDRTMSICLRINTLLLLAGAENDNWETAEAYRVRAEKWYALAQSLVAEPPTPAEEAASRELREALDRMLKYQADEAPPMHHRLKDAHYPAREGILVDFLFERKMRKEQELDYDRISFEEEEALRALERDVKST